MSYWTALGLTATGLATIGVFIVFALSMAKELWKAAFGCVVILIFVYIPVDAMALSWAVTHGG